jgi:hypothetical protein
MIANALMRRWNIRDRLVRIEHDELVALLDGKHATSG